MVNCTILPLSEVQGSLGGYLQNMSLQTIAADRGPIFRNNDSSVRQLHSNSSASSTLEATPGPTRRRDLPVLPDRLFYPVNPM